MLKNTLSGFVGEILQVPPIFSALKIDGQRSYKLARQGIEPNMQPRKIKIYSLELLHYDGEEASLKVHCGKGTYVRALARDIAVKLGTVAYITELRRTKLGNFSIDQGILLDNLLKLVHTLEPIDKFMSVEIALDDILAIDISESEMHSLRQGKSIICEHNMLEDGVIKALYNDKLIALGEYQAGYFKPNRVFNH
jgi:tRNA pseudouridine55 synthase